mmetsp:Transcript_14781/g.31907  ORF Transcript_14781/g.31907 Transcript_14781/m.31907 type:complete len:208 (-) Transcript_14781:8-631(-)
MDERTLRRCSGTSISRLWTSDLVGVVVVLGLQLPELGVSLFGLLIIILILRLLFFVVFALHFWASDGLLGMGVPSDASRLRNVRTFGRRGGRFGIWVDSVLRNGWASVRKLLWQQHLPQLEQPRCQTEGDDVHADQEKVDVPREDAPALPFRSQNEAKLADVGQDPARSHRRERRRPHHFRSQKPQGQKASNQFEDKDENHNDDDVP